MTNPLETNGVSFTPSNNPKGVNPVQRKILEAMIEKKIISGTKEGIDYMTRKEADKLIIEARQNGAKV